MKLLLNTKFLFVAFAMFMGASVYSQNRIEASEFDSNWTLLTEKDGVKLYVQKGECKMGDVPTPFTYGFLKVENTTDSPKHVNFNIHRFYTDGCAGCDNHNEEYSSVSVDANSTLIGDCSFEHSQLALLIVNPLQTDYQELTYISLIDLIID